MRPRRRHRPRRCSIARLAGLAILSSGLWTPTQGQPAPPTEVPVPGTPLDVDAVLWDLASTEPEVVQAALEHLADAPGPVSDRLLPRVLDLARVPGPAQSAAVRSLGHWVRPQPVHVLIDLLDTAPEGSPLPTAALEALTRSTGLTRSARAWTSWGDQRRSLPEPVWYEQLTRDLADERATAVTDAVRAGRAAATFARRVYLLTPPEDRATQLIAVLASEVPQVRTAALELAERQVASGDRLVPEVLSAVGQVLLADRPEHRAAAAVVLGRTGSEPALGLVRDALHRESDAQAAASMLSACARTPTNESVGDALRWLSVEGPTAGPAAEAVAQALLQPDWPDREALLRAARGSMAGIQPHAAGPQQLRLLALIADDGVLDAIVGLLEADARRDSAARALALTPAGLARLEATAGADPALAVTIASGILRLDDEPAALARLLALAWPDAETRDASLDAWAAAAAPGTLLRAIAAAPDDVSIVVLSAFAERTPPPAPLGQTAQAWARLHELALAAGEPATAESASARLAGLDPLVWAELPDAERNRIEAALPAAPEPVQSASDPEG